MRPWMSPIFQRVYLLNLVVILTLFFSTIMIARHVLPDLAQKKAYTLTEKMSTGIQEQARLLHEQLSEVVQNISSEEVFQQGHLSSMNRRVDEIVRDSPLIDGAALISPKGELEGFYKLSDLHLLRDTRLVDLDKFRRAANKKVSSVSDVVTFEVGKSALFISVPVIDANLELKRIVTLHIYVSQNSLLQSIFQPHRIQESGSAVIVDRNGIVLSHPDPSMIGQDISASSMAVELRLLRSGYQGPTELFGTEVYGHYLYLPEWEWGVIAYVPEAELMESLEALNRMLLPLFLLIIIPVSIVSVLYARRIILPIQRLYHSVEHVARGNFTFKIHTKDTDRSELGLLSRRYNEMVDSLSQAHLEIRSKERLLQEQHAYLRKIVDLNPNYIYTKDQEGRLLLVNRSFAKLWGKEPEELVGHYEQEFRSLTELEASRTLEEQLLEGNTEGMELEETLTTPQGETRWVQTAKLLLSESNREPAVILSVSTDITERRKTEELLRTSEKLSVAGELAAGVAHEIRNPLTSLKGFLRLLELKADTTQLKYLDIMSSEMDRIHFIVNEFLMLSKPQAVTFQLKPLVAILRSVITLLESQANLCGVYIEADFSLEEKYIVGEENQLKQVFVNLLKNGIEAMPEGGTIRIHVFQYAPGRVGIRFQDEGCGIPPELLAKIGQPFYTTKEKGTGLGLMVTFRIIEAHEGTIQFRSEVGAGTTIELTFPEAPTQVVGSIIPEGGENG